MHLLLLIAPGQLISWGTLYYAIAFLSDPIQQETGWGGRQIFLAFSAGLLVAAVAAAPVGRVLSRCGGRAVLATGSVISAIALAIVGLSPNLGLFTVGWVLAGLAMALTQYEAAFSTLRQLVPQDFRRVAGWITVVGGLASSLFWPLTHGLTEAFGWRLTLLTFGALHIVPGLLLHLRLPSADTVTDHTRRSPRDREPNESARGALAILLLLGLAFSGAALVTGTISAHSKLLMEAAHVPTGIALMLLMAIGPMQIAGRLFDLGLASRVAPSAMGLSASLVLAFSLLLLQSAQGGFWAVAGFSVMYGAANGILTVVRGSIPIELLPDLDYAASLGKLAAPTLLAKAVAPALAAWFIDTQGALALTGTLSLLAVGSFSAFGAAVLLARKNQGAHQLQSRL